MDCPICKDPRAHQIIQQIRNNEISIADGAKLLGVKYRVLWNHLRAHEPKEVDQLRETSIDTLELLESIAIVLRKKLIDLEEMEVRPTTISALAKVCDSLRHTCMDIERLTGKLRTAPLIQLQKITIHYEVLLQIISTELCPLCRKKVLTKLEEMR